MGLLFSLKLFFFSNFISNDVASSINNVNIHHFHLGIIMF